MPRAIKAVYDANVLYPAPLRDLLIRIAQTGLVRARWTEAIHDEWNRNVLRDHPNLTAHRLLRTRSLMNDAVRDCLITGYEHRIESLTLPDADDRHVLAAAIHARASAIVTFNCRDFPDAILTPFGIRAIHPDDFVNLLFQSSPGSIVHAVRRQREGLRNPPKTAEELLDTLESQGLIQTVAQLRLFVEQL